MVQLTCSRLKFLWSIPLFMVVLSFALTGCGEASTPASPTQSNSSQQSSSASGSQSSASGDTASAVAIAEQAGANDIYSFDPATISIKAGGAIKFTNNSDENHKLAIAPAGPTAGTVMRSGSTDNTLTVTFPTAGTYTITSQLVDRLKDGKHTPDPADSQAKLTVTVTA